jgi:glycosyltransferase involved in cell wall biosynthesis
MVILPRFPYPLEKGDKLRAYFQIKELSQKYDITLVAVSHRNVEQNSINKLKDYCSSIHIIRINFISVLWNLFLCIFNDKPFQVGYFYSSKGKKDIKSLLKSRTYKHIYCQLVRTSEYAKDIYNIPKTIDYMDALSKGIERRIDKVSWYKKWLFREESRRLKQYERSIFDYFDNRTIISEQDRELIPHPDRSKIRCIPNGIDEQFFHTLPIEKEYDLVFVGNLSYPPNIEAVEYIAETILSNDKTLTCLISGATPHPSVVRICRSNPQITLTGWVEDIRESYCKGRIFVAPMMIGTGMQNKLLEAMALGTPCITTSLANNAINGKDKESVIVADSPQQFMNGIRALLSDPAMCELLIRNGRELVRNSYSWKKSTEELIDLIEKTNK